MTNHEPQEAGVPGSVLVLSSRVALQQRTPGAGRCVVERGEAGLTAFTVGMQSHKRLQRVLSMGGGSAESRVFARP